MKSLQDLYSEIIGSDELKKAFAEAAKGGKVADFLKARGCEATAEEINAFLKGKADQPLSDAELDSVAGGTCNSKTAEEARWSVLTIGLGCFAYAVTSYVEGHAGQKEDDEGRLCTE